MLKKTLLCAVLLLSIFTIAHAGTGILKPKTNTNFACFFTQTNFAIELTYGTNSFSTTELDFAARYVSNPYTQAQWTAGIVVGHVDCHSSAYLYGRKTQYDGRVMEAGITTTGDIIIKWISGPLMPLSANPRYYFLEMPHLAISSTGG